MDKPEIVFCAYGSRAKSAQESYSRMELAVTEALPGHSLSWAYTGHKIRQMMARQGNSMDSPAQALARLALAGPAKTGPGRAVLFSLHLLPAAEYEHLLGAALGDHSLAKVVVSRPLLDKPQDYLRLAGAIMAALPKERQPGEPVVLAGHGTAHSAGRGYLELGRQLVALDKDIHLAVLEHGPGLESLLPRLKAHRPSRIWLMPLLVTVGVHAGRDVLGPEPVSWQNRLEKAGFECRGVIRALADLEEVRAIWLDHLCLALQDLAG